MNDSKKPRLMNNRQAAGYFLLAAKNAKLSRGLTEELLKEMYYCFDGFTEEKGEEKGFKWYNSLFTEFEKTLNDSRKEIVQEAKRKKDEQFGTLGKLAREHFEQKEKDSTIRIYKQAFLETPPENLKVVLEILFVNYPLSEEDLNNILKEHNIDEKILDRVRKKK
ncbi:hypothetical protein ACFVSS_17495 [Peribacillus butanolivorans]|uniref:hypothetical protein n=1 Tax=Peribacillus butanolivorans TaxID=421767 RepID=UPI0036D77D0C